MGFNNHPVYIYIPRVTRNIPTRNMPTRKLSKKKNSETLTSTSREPPDLELRIPTRANRATNRNNVATQVQSYFLWVYFLWGYFIEPTPEFLSNIESIIYVKTTVEINSFFLRLQLFFQTGCFWEGSQFI